MFSCEDTGGKDWVAMIHEHKFRRGAAWPAPFSASTQRFKALSDLRRWLNGDSDAEGRSD